MHIKIVVGSQKFFCITIFLHFLNFFLYVFINIDLSNFVV